MARPVTADMVAALVAAAKRPALFYQGNFVSGTVNAWSGLGDFVWNGITWKGLGQLAGVQSVGETTDIAASGVVFTLAGVPSDLLALLLAETAHGLTGALWLGFLDDTGALIASPMQLFAGQMDVPQIVESIAGPQIQISYENRLIDLQRPRLQYYTTADQQANFPDDLGFAFVPAAQEWMGTWGGPGTSAPASIHTFPGTNIPVGVGGAW